MARVGTEIQLAAGESFDYKHDAGAGRKAQSIANLRHHLLTRFSVVGSVLTLVGIYGVLSLPVASAP